MMRFQVNHGWAIGQFLIPPSTIIDIADKPEHELSEFERLARGKIPPLDAIALDWDAAVAMHRSYHPDFNCRLQRRLGPYDEDMFQRITSGKLFSEDVLQRHWPRGKG